MGLHLAVTLGENMSSLARSRVRRTRTPYPEGGHPNRVVKLQVVPSPKRSPAVSAANIPLTPKALTLPWHRKLGHRLALTAIAGVSLLLHAGVGLWLQHSAQAEEELIVQPKVPPMVAVSFVPPPPPAAPIVEAPPAVEPPPPPPPKKKEGAAKKKAEPKPEPKPVEPPPVDAPPVEVPPPPVREAPPQPVERPVTQPLAYAAYLRSPAPEYPAAALRRGYEGKVLLRVQVSAEGLAKTVEIAQSSGRDILDEAAVKTVRKWRFVPAMKGT